MRDGKDCTCNVPCDLVLSLLTLTARLHTRTYGTAPQLFFALQRGKLDAVVVVAREERERAMNIQQNASRQLKWWVIVTVVVTVTVVVVHIPTYMQTA